MRVERRSVLGGELPICICQDISCGAEFVGLESGCPTWCNNCGEKWMDSESE